MTRKHPRSGHEDISAWASAIDASIAKAPDCCVRRAVVLELTPSTMDALDGQGGVDDGLLVVALRQTHGRGQRGRQWDDGDGHTLACTFVLDTSAIDLKVLSTLVACAVHETICGFVPQPSCALIKWPNDIVIRDGDWKQDRKLAGILIEQRGRRASIGIGINCSQQPKDWSADNQGRAVSLVDLGADISRLNLLCKLIERLSEWLNRNDPEMIQNHLKAHDAMIGTRRTFRVGDRQYKGVVEMIEPFEHIALRTSTGLHKLSIAQTQHIRDENLQ